MVKPLQLSHSPVDAPSSFDERVKLLEAMVVNEFSITLNMPPSTNKLYQRRKGGGLAPTTEAKKFKRAVQRVIGEPRNVAHLATFPTQPEVRYRVEYIIYFPALENPGWFEFWKKDTYVSRGKHKGELKGRKGERKAKTRYKVIDYDNRIKFMQDCLVEAIGFNDCQIFSAEVEKREDEDNPRVHVYIEVMDEEF